MNTPEIDVIIAVYNGALFIEEAIASVQTQSWKNVNIIVADDGSTDGTVAIISKLCLMDRRISLLSLPHRGVSATLNEAINSSGADFIAFLDADDYWSELKLEKQMRALDGEDAEICFCMMQEFQNFDEGEPQTHNARMNPLKGYSKTAFLGTRKVFNTFGLFDEKISIGDFVDWFSRTVRAKVPVIMLDEVLAYRRVHEHNTTRTASKSAFLKLIKNHLDEQRKDV